MNFPNFNIISTKLQQQQLQQQQQQQQLQQSDNDIGNNNNNNNNFDSNQYEGGNREEEEGEGEELKEPIQQKELLVEGNQSDEERILLLKGRNSIIITNEINNSQSIPSNMSLTTVRKNTQDQQQQQQQQTDREDTMSRLTIITNDNNNSIAGISISNTKIVKTIEYEEDGEVKKITMTRKELEEFAIKRKNAEVLLDTIESKPEKYYFCALFQTKPYEQIVKMVNENFESDINKVKLSIMSKNTDNRTTYFSQNNLKNSAMCDKESEEIRLECIKVIRERCKASLTDGDFGCLISEIIKYNQITNTGILDTDTILNDMEELKFLNFVSKETYAFYLMCQILSKKKDPINIIKMLLNQQDNIQKSRIADIIAFKRFEESILEAISVAEKIELRAEYTIDSQNLNVFNQAIKRLSVMNEKLSSVKSSGTCTVM